MMKTSEEWKPVYGYEDFYKVSTLGAVRSLDRLAPGRHGCMRNIKGRQLSANDRGNGYPAVTLSAHGNKKTIAVHRLVAEAFIARPVPTGMEVCHNDGNPMNSKLSNLRLDSRSGNFSDKLRHGTHNRGARHNLAKLNEGEALAIFYDTRKQRLIARDYGVSQKCVWSIKSGDTWWHVTGKTARR